MDPLVVPGIPARRRHRMVWRPLAHVASVDGVSQEESALGCQDSQMRTPWACGGRIHRQEPGAKSLERTRTAPDRRGQPAPPI